MKKLKTALKSTRKAEKKLSPLPLKVSALLIFFSMFPTTVIGAERFNLSMTNTHLMHIKAPGSGRKTPKIKEIREKTKGKRLFAAGKKRKMGRKENDV